MKIVATIEARMTSALARQGIFASHGETHALSFGKPIVPFLRLMKLPRQLPLMQRMMS